MRVCRSVCVASAHRKQPAMWPVALQAPPAALHSGQQHQQQPHVALNARQGCKAAAAATPSARRGRRLAARAAAAAPTRGRDELPLVLERGYRTSSLSRDRLSTQQQELYTNMGAAVRALQQDLPSILERPPDLSVFAEGMLFEDRLSPRLGLPACSCSGKEAYRRLLWSLRFHRALFFSRARVELQRMWEREPGVVCVRWSAAACPRLLDGLLAKGDAAMSLDGVSEFHFNEQGRVMKHTLDCVAYSGPKAVPNLLLARYGAALAGAGPQRRRAMVPGLAGGSWDEC